MGLFSKLLGKEVEKKAQGVLKGLKDLAEGLDGDKNEAPQVSQPYNTEAPVYEPVPEGPSGDSWGPVMPAEENQYNSGLPYYTYFRNIFQTEFPAYQLLEEDIGDRRATVFTFTNDGGTALVVELLSRRSDFQKRRNICRSQGIPYLRFYYDYDGWWNTRSYVIRRTKEALNG